MDSIIIFGILTVIVLLKNYKNKLEQRLERIERMAAFTARLLKKQQDEGDLILRKDEYFVPERENALPKQNPQEKTVEEPEKTIVSELRPEPQAESITEDETVSNVEKLHVIKESLFQRFTGYIENKKSTTHATKDTKTTGRKGINWEKIIGENLMSIVGIGILVFGLGFFVKYMIDENWIGNYMRAAIGILAGGALISVAHYLRKKYLTFASLLIGGGMATLYYTIYLAFQEYHIFSQTVAFIVMVLITSFAVLLSVSYNRRELAIYAILGGFISPMLVSTGSGNYIVLFTYILILDVGMLILAYYKKWNIVNIISYIFTVLLYGGWLTKELFDSSAPPYAGAFIYATVFFLVFIMMNIANHMRTGVKLSATEISILLSNTFCYFGAGLVILHEAAPQYKGLFTAFIAIFNFVFVYTLYRNKHIDKNLLYLFVGLVLTFISLIGPIQLHGNYITLFWAAESVLVLWLFIKSEIKLIKYSSVLVVILTFISLMMDFENVYTSIYNEQPHAIIFNKGFVVGIVSIVAFVLCIVLLPGVKDERMLPYLSKRVYRTILFALTLSCTYMTFLFELTYQLEQTTEVWYAVDAVVASYNFVFLAGLLLWAHYSSNTYLKWLMLAFSFAGIVSYFMYYQSEVFIELRREYLIEKVEFSYFLLHYIAIVALPVILMLTAKISFKIFSIKQFRYISWSLMFTFVFMLSAELDHLVILSGFKSPELSHLSIEKLQEVLFVEIWKQEKILLRSSHFIGFPILWGVCSFVLMLAGLKQRSTMLRFMALALLGVTLAKLFIIDVWSMSQGGRIAAFILLGLMISILSFLYQKLRQILFDEQPEE